MTKCDKPWQTQVSKLYSTCEICNKKFKCKILIGKILHPFDAIPEARFQNFDSTSICQIHQTFLLSKFCAIQ